MSDGIRRRLVRAAKGPMVGVLDESAITVLDRPVRHTGFEGLARGSHCLLVTYRRDGTPVPTPVWFALDGERLYVWTEIEAYKAKRIRNDDRALIAPCGPTGKPLGDPIAARGRILETDAERARAAKVTAASWNPLQRAFRAVGHTLTEVHYLEFVPA